KNQQATAQAKAAPPPPAPPSPPPAVKPEAPKAAAPPPPPAAKPEPAKPAPPPAAAKAAPAPAPKPAEPAAPAAPTMMMGQDKVQEAITPKEAEAGINFGQYLLLSKIATGGMAELYKAKRKGVEGFEKILAIKKILPHMSDNEEFITMFIDEA